MDVSVVKAHCSDLLWRGPSRGHWENSGCRGLASPVILSISRCLVWHVVAYLSMSNTFSESEYWRILLVTIWWCHRFPWPAIRRHSRNGKWNMRFSRKGKSVRWFVCMLFLLANSGSTCWDCGVLTPTSLHCFSIAEGNIQPDEINSSFFIFFYFLSTSRAKYTTTFLIFSFIVVCMCVSGVGGEKENENNKCLCTCAGGQKWCPVSFSIALHFTFEILRQGLSLNLHLNNPSRLAVHKTLRILLALLPPQPQC